MLKISSVIIPQIRNQVLTVLRNTKNHALERIPDRDIFIRTLKTSYISEQRAREIYDEIYDEIIAQNVENSPILKDVTINKPEIEFKKVYDGRFNGTYSPIGNTIAIDLDNLNLLKKCAIIFYNDNGEIGDVCWFGLEALLKDARKKMKAINPNICIIKPNQDEQEIMLKSILAHELRHCIQTHLILSSEGGYKNIKEQIRAKIASIKETIEEAKKLGEDISDYDISEFEDLYLFKYKPKKILPKDAQFKVSLDEKDDNYWSIYDDFVAESNAQIPNIFNKQEYLSSIREIDAYKYQYEYCLLKAQDWYDTTSAREEFLIPYLSCRFLSDKLNYEL